RTRGGRVPNEAEGVCSPASSAPARRPAATDSSCRVRPGLLLRSPRGRRTRPRRSQHPDRPPHRRRPLNRPRPPTRQTPGGRRSRICGRGSAVSGERILALTVPDWPAVAAAAEHGIGPGRPVAVLHGGRVIAANAPARAAGVAVGDNKRAVGFRCPEAQVVVWDEDADNRHFCAGVGALEDLVARFHTLSPGRLAIPLDSLRHGYRDESSAVEALVSPLVTETGWEFSPGIADTVFAAVLASGRPVGSSPDGPWTSWLTSRSRPSNMPGPR